MKNGSKDCKVIDMNVNGKIESKMFCTVMGTPD